MLQRIQNWFLKQEMEFFKKEMELFLPLPGIQSKNFFYLMFFIHSKGFKIDFKNRKWNHANRKWNCFSHFWASYKKFFYRVVFNVPKNPKLIFKTGNGIVKTGYLIIFPTSKPLIKNFFYRLFFVCSWGFKLDFQNRKLNYPNRKWNYFSPFQFTDQKTSFTTCFSLIFKQEMELSKQEMKFFLSFPGLQ